MIAHFFSPNHRETCKIIYNKKILTFSQYKNIQPNTYPLIFAT
nr:MAG TPA: hypothetical protein [Caudoviricetes sp.]